MSNGGDSVSKEVSELWEIDKEMKIWIIETVLIKSVYYVPNCSLKIMTSKLIIKLNSLSDLLPGSDTTKWLILHIVTSKFPSSLK